MVKFTEMEYTRPNMAVFKEKYTQIVDTMEKATCYEEFKNAYLALDKLTMELSSMESLAYIRNTIDTSDPFYDGEVDFFNEELPQLTEIQIRANKVLLGTPFKKDYEDEYGDIIIKNLEAQLKLLDPAIIPEKIEEANLSKEYSKETASASVDFMGKKCNFYGLLKYMQDTDREVRKAAFEAWADLYNSISDKLDDIFDKLIKVRCSMAKKLGFDSYTDMAYIDRQRFDYTQKDVKVFRDMIAKYVTPVCQKLYDAQKDRLGIDKLRLYDEELVFPDWSACPIGDRDYLVNMAKEMYSELSPETSEFFDFMTDYELFDLETKPNKHMGGYCTCIAKYAAPFIFSNFNGTSADVDVLTHEAGHAFQFYTAARIMEISDMVSSTSEIDEIHSMTMEHFTYPWMEKFFGDNAGKYRFLHLSNSLTCIPYLVSVDEFQHKVYEKPDMDHMERRKVWRDIERKYMPWRDYDGNDFLEKGGYWMQKQHIFMYPFYYVDYALAQMCAYQLYGRMKIDKKAAWNDYYELCKAGGSKGYFDLLKLANLSNPFTEKTIKDTTAAIADELLSQI